MGLSLSFFVFLFFAFIWSCFYSILQLNSHWASHLFFSIVLMLHLPVTCVSANFDFEGKLLFSSRREWEERKKVIFTLEKFFALRVTGESKKKEKKNFFFFVKSEWKRRMNWSFLAFGQLCKQMSHHKEPQEEKVTSFTSIHFVHCCVCLSCERRKNIKEIPCSGLSVLCEKFFFLFLFLTLSKSNWERIHSIGDGKGQ